MLRVMNPQQLQAAAARRADDIFRGFGDNVRRLREDAGVSQRALSRFTGVDQSEISRIEAGRARPSIETCTKLGAGLGSDLSMRLFPNTGSPIRDRHQAPIVEALIAGLERRWGSWPEVGVRQPVRGWIDVVLADPVAQVLVAVEVVSMITRFEQLLRWSGAKAEALPSAPQWPFGVAEPRIDRVLIVRATSANTAILSGLRATVDAAFPADRWHAIASLRGAATWPGSVLLWASDRRNGDIEIIPDPRRGRRA